MSPHQEDRAGPGQRQVGAGGTFSVDARGGIGVQVGEGNTQIIYTYNRLTWTDGVAPPPLVSVSGVVDSPYRGLSAFEEQDAAFFFGREAATTHLLDRMSRLLQGTSLLVVSGVSGAGKSSLLRAGVLPRIRAAGLAGAQESASWPCLVFTPTRSPLDELALRVALLAGADAAAVRRTLDADPEGFALTARQAALTVLPGPALEPVADRYRPPRQPRLLLVVDQFEQVFTQCPDEGQRRAFITALCAAAGAQDGPDQAPAALVVLGVRADFEATCANYPQLADPVQDRYLVTAMTERQLRMAIREPAKKAGSLVEDDLIEILLADVHTRQPGAVGVGVLPLLSHALDQAWRSRAGEALTVADYERTGGIEGAVADSAQHVYDHLTPAQQLTARQVFTRLTATSTDGMDTANRVTRAELAEGKSAAEVKEVAAVLEAFAAERLLTLAADSVELSHEVLLTAWPLLRDTWLTETHADRIVRTRLHNVATEWSRHSHDPSYLYSGTLLQAAAQTAARIGADPARNPPLGHNERHFLHASNRAQRRVARRRHAVIAGLLALTLTAVTAAGIAVSNAAGATRQAANATRQHAIALSRQLAAESMAIDPTYPVVARRLAAAAWHISPTYQAGSALSTLLAEQLQGGIVPADPSTVNGVAFSPDGKLLATADGDGTARLWNPATGRPVGAPLHATSAKNGVNKVAFSPDGKLLATADGDGTVRLWNPATGRPVGAPLHATSAQNGVDWVAFSPDGKLLATADGDTVRLWNPATGRPVGASLHARPSYAFHAGPADQDLVNAVNGVAFTPRGKLLATAHADGTVRLWNPATGKFVGAPLQADAHYSVDWVAFTPNGKLLATFADDTVRLWNLATGRPVGASIHTGSGSQDVVSGLAFTRDSKLLATAHADGTVRLWNPATGKPARAPLQTGAENGVNGVAFSPDGKLLASADSDGTARLWNPATGQPVGAPLQVGAYEVAFSSDAKLLASADSDGTVRLWNPATRQAVGAPLQTGSQNGVKGVAFSPDGKLLASADGDGNVKLWNPATGRPIGVSPQIDPSDVLLANGLAFSPDSKLLATADGDGTVRLWNPATGKPVGAPLQSGSPGLTVVAFSPEGKLLASADDTEGTVSLWNLATRRAVGAPLQTGAQNGVNGVAFSPDGKLLATADGDGNVKLWNPGTRRAVGAPLQTGVRNPVQSVAFSPDGKLLATVDGVGTIRLWDLSLFANAYEVLCADVGPPTRHDWDQYAAGEPQPKVCS